ncbi:hypothetical protein ASJ81_20230 [Methanosarcina spelaei]|uniref:PKD domain-containing protein n=1 Tax=Methanosarcina spelaei TaxID=1036679 RepID=A0A2A2HT81_9EURY|nr:hypothetical protein ASJ81_20230 [Methanosarcina spelaei]
MKWSFGDVIISRKKKIPNISVFQEGNYKVTVTWLTWQTTCIEQLVFKVIFRVPSFIYSTCFLFG